MKRASAALRSSLIVVVLLFAGFYWLFGGSGHYQLLGVQQGYSPKQPIPFFHALHAGTFAISCLYCHSGALKSDVAGVPAVNVCMNCHSVIQKDPDTGKPLEGIDNLLEAWATAKSSEPKPIEWTRVDNLPAYVHFSHRAHVANNIGCETCHGPVRTMDRLHQFAPLTMGWCLQCHRMKRTKISESWKNLGGPMDCGACHW